MPSDQSDHELAALLGHRLRVARARAKLEQKDAARMVGCSPRSLSAWESGSARMPAVALPRLAAIYRVTVEWLLAPNVPFLALIDRKSERDAVTARGIEEMDRITKTLTVLVSEHLDSVTSPEEWSERIRAVHARRSELTKENDG